MPVVWQKQKNGRSTEFGKYTHSEQSGPFSNGVHCSDTARLYFCVLHVKYKMQKHYHHQWISPYIPEIGVCTLGDIISPR